MKNDDKENQVDGNLPPVEDALLEKLKNILFDTYHPVTVPRDGVIFMGTREIWNMLQRLYPNEVLYQPGDVANWLHEKGYHFFDQGQMRYEWMLLPV